VPAILFGATNMAKPTKPLGIVLHRGQSPFASGQYVVIALLGKSSNEKTGGMIQTYVIVDDAAKPTETVKAGTDSIVCGDCPLRGILGKMGRACYVNLGQGPRAVHQAYLAGKYAEYDPAIHDRFFAGKMIRWGTYGEPVLIPLATVQHLNGLASGWTGYTHQWSKPEFAAYRDVFMASVHDSRSADHAKHLGWRYFRSAVDATPGPGEIVCPASKEAGKRTTCADCGICNGRGPNDTPNRVSVVIAIHGGFGVMAAAKHTPAIAS
jgi:hypothetical protein